MAGMKMSRMATWLPWTDRAGRLSWLKLVVFLGCLAPGLYMLAQIQFGWLSPKPVTDLIRECGDWVIRFIVFALAVTPIRHVIRWNKLVDVRRMLGLSAMFYALLHFSLYCLDENFVWTTIASEIALRIYLTIGFVALLGLVALGATSNDFAIRRLGAMRWNRLQRAVYVIALLGLIHYFIQLRLDATSASLMAGYFFLLIAYRLMKRLGWDKSPAALVGLAVLSGFATAIIEAGYYGLATGVNAALVLEANLHFAYSIRPAWWVFLGGLALALLKWAGVLLGKRSPARRARQPAPASV